MDRPSLFTSLTGAECFCFKDVSTDICALRLSFSFCVEQQQMGLQLRDTTHKTVDI